MNLTCCNTDNATLRNKLQGNLNHNMVNFIHGKASEKVFYKTKDTFFRSEYLNTLRLERNGRHFKFKKHFRKTLLLPSPSPLLSKFDWIFVPEGLIDHKSAQIQIMAWWRTDSKPYLGLPESMKTLSNDAIRSSPRTPSIQHKPTQSFPYLWWLFSPHYSNTLPPERFGCYLKIVIFKLISRIDTLRISCEITLRWKPQDRTDD